VLRQINSGALLENAKGGAVGIRKNSGAEMQAAEAKSEKSVKAENELAMGYYGSSRLREGASLPVKWAAKSLSNNQY